VYPDYQKSKNVVGHASMNGSTYIFIGSGASTELFLTKKVPTHSYISEASVLINSYNGDVVKGESFYPGHIKINKKGIVTKIKIAQVGPFIIKVPTL